MIKTKQELLNHFSDINGMYNNPFMYQTLSNMIDELLEQQSCDDCISRTEALRLIDEERQHLLRLNMDGSEHIIVHYARRIIEDMPSASSVDCIDRQKTIAEIQYKYYDNAIGIDIVDMIAHMPSVTPKARWIPVSEEPKEAGSYITTIKYGDKYAVGQRYYHGKYVGWEDSCVIAYMPLPKPYEESEDKE